jgi:hypothetical protein
LLGDEEVLATNEKSSELTQPGFGASDDPSSSIAAQLAAVLETLVYTVGSVRDDKVDAALFESLTQWIGAAGTVGDHSPGLLSRSAFGARIPQA